jgi:hypothetical protein
MKKTYATTFILVIALNFTLHSQNVGIGTNSPHPSSKLVIVDNQNYIQVRFIFE